MTTNNREKGQSKKGRERQDKENSKRKRRGALQNKTLEERTGGDLQTPWRIHKRSAYAPMIFLEVHPCFVEQLLSFSEFFSFLFFSSFDPMNTSIL